MKSPKIMLSIFIGASFLSTIGYAAYDPHYSSPRTVHPNSPKPPSAPLKKATSNAPEHLYMQERGTQDVPDTAMKGVLTPDNTRSFSSP